MAGTTTGAGTDCVLKPFERNRYFYGKLLTVRDFEVEQSYLNEKRHLLNRFIHGAGVVCGLGTVQQGAGVAISPGVALDSCGREIVLVDQPTKIADLTTLSGYTAGLGTEAPAYLCLKYAECLREPVTALANASTCEDACEYNRVQERFALVLTGTEPPAAAAPVCADQETVVYSDGQVTVRRTTPRWVREKEIFEITLAMEAAAAHTVVVTEHLTGDLLPIRGLTPVGGQPTHWKVTLSSGVSQASYLVQAADGPAHVSIGAQVQVDGGAQHNATGNSGIAIGPISQGMVEAYFVERLNSCPQGSETDCVYLASLSLDEDGKVTEIGELFPGDPYVYNNPLLYQLIACEESGRGEIPLIDVQDSGVQVVSALSTLNIARGLKAQAAASSVNQADVSANLGPGLKFGGLGGDQIQADLGVGLKFDGNHIAADVGNGLKLVGNQVQPDYATTATAGKVCEANDPRLSDARQPLPHKTTHQNGGSDEIDVAGLSGVLADAQKVIVQDEGTVKGTSNTLNFTGTGVSVSEDLAQKRVNINIAGFSGVAVQDDGTLKGTRPALNFTGPGASVSDDAANNRVNINIPAGGHPPYLALRYICGDGQQAAPGSQLPCRLAVGVEDENGLPIADISVVFTPQQSDDQLIPPVVPPLNNLPVAVTGPLTVPTDKNGLASVLWVLGKETGCHRVVATLAKPPQKEALPVMFEAHAVTGEKPAETWPKVSGTNWKTGDDVPLDVLLKEGLIVEFTVAMDKGTATPANFIVAAELTAKDENTGYFGYRPMILAGYVEVVDDMTWAFKLQQVITTDHLKGWQSIAGQVFDNSTVRVRVALKSSARGDGIRSQDGRPLDGNDDDVKGGDFESWFNLA